MIISVVSVQIAWLLGLHRVTDDERELETLSIVPDVEVHEYSIIRSKKNRCRSRSST